MLNLLLETFILLSISDKQTFYEKNVHCNIPCPIVLGYGGHFEKNGRLSKFRLDDMIFYEVQVFSKQLT
jgi:hypothetical protein